MGMLEDEKFMHAAYELRRTEFPPAPGFFWGITYRYIGYYFSTPNP